MQRTGRIRTGLVAIAVLVAASASSAGGGTAEPTVVSVRDVRFEAGDVLAVALHPSTTPIELSARRLDLEACPGSWDGGVGTAENSSWPKNDGFTECIPFRDGTAVLPSAAQGGGAMHLVFAVRARAANARPGTLTIRYEPADGFFMVGPPALPPDARSPTIVHTPAGDTFAAGTATFEGGDQSAELQDVRLTVRQRGRTVRRTPSLDDQSVWPAYSPVRPGQPVTVRASNDGSERIRFTIGLEVSSTFRQDR